MDINKKQAVIFGITGQDGFYLSKLLLKYGYEVIGVARDILSENSIIRQDLGVNMFECDINDSLAVLDLLSELSPDEIYNLAGESSVQNSWKYPAAYSQTNALGVLNILEALKITKLGFNKTRYFQASSSEMFGNTGPKPIDERHRLQPRSPYGASKAFAHLLTGVYRESYDFHASSGILFNHESPLRNENFVSKKICAGAVKIARGQLDKITLGNLEVYRDWSFAGDVVRAIWLMMQQDKPDDFVISSGQLNSVKDFVKSAFLYLGIQDWEKYIKIDKSMIRINEIIAVQGDSHKARSKLAWEPEYDFDRLVGFLIQAELDRPLSKK